MNERIIIKSFGPISDIDIIVKDVNIFIGTTSSGKSTVAKLIGIFQNESIRSVLPNSEPVDVSNRLKEFKKLLVSFNIDFSFNSETLIRYELGDFFCEISENFYENTFSPFNFPPSFNLVYIPAERVFFSTLSQSMFGLAFNDISLPKWLLDFGNKFEKARRNLGNVDINFLDIKYKFQDGNDVIELENGNTIKLSQASSGVQSTIPLILVLKSLTEDQNNFDEELSSDLFIIEEPEINLYPSSQKSLLEFIIDRVNRRSHKLIITTHSPYILTSLDNLVQAKNAAHGKDVDEEVDQLVPTNLWTDFDNVTCHFFDNGTARSTLDMELRSLGPSNIDSVSEELAKTFDKLLELKYNDR